MESSTPTAALDGLRIVELSAFVAVPLAGMTLAQLGADVIRVDPIGGGLDYRRRPITDSGAGLYWAGLNKGKRSVTLNLRSKEGTGPRPGSRHRAGQGHRRVDHQPLPALDLLRRPPP